MVEGATCVSKETDFFKIDSFVLISETCTGHWGYALASSLINIVLTSIIIYLAAQRYRYERGVQFQYRTGTVAYKFAMEKYLTSLTFHQLFRLLHFLFLIYTNWLQLILTTIINVVVNYYIYKWGMIKNDYDELFQYRNVKTKEDEDEKDKSKDSDKKDGMFPGASLSLQLYDTY